MEAYKHSIRLLSDLQQLYAIIVVNMNKGESYLFKGNEQVSNFFSIFKDRLYPQLQPLDRTSNYMFLYCSNDIDIFIAKKALNLCSIHQVTPIDMAQIQRNQNAQKTVEKHDAAQSSQTMINRPLDESGKNDGKNTELPNATTASGSLIKESNTINNLNLEPAMEKRRLPDLDLSGRERTPPRSESHRRQPSPSPSPNLEVFRRRHFSPSSAQSSHPPQTQTNYYSVQTRATDRTPQQSTSRPIPPRTVRRERQISDPIPKESASKTEDPNISPIIAPSKDLSSMFMSPTVQNLKNIDLKPLPGMLQIDPKHLRDELRAQEIEWEKLPHLKGKRVREPEPPKKSDDMELTRVSTHQQNKEAQQKELKEVFLQEVNKSFDKIEKELREQHEKEEREKRARAAESRLKPQANVLIEDLLETRRERQNQQRKKKKEKQLAKLRKQPGKKLKEKQLTEAQEQQKQHEEKLREQQEREGKELRENLLKEVELRKAQEGKEKELGEKRLREVREQQEKELEEARNREKEELRKARKQQEKDLSPPQTPERKLEFTPSPPPTQLPEEVISIPDTYEESEFQKSSPSTSKKIMEEIQGTKKPLKETEQIISTTSAKESSAKERFDRLSTIASLRLEDLHIPYIDGTPSEQEEERADNQLSKFKFGRGKNRKKAIKIFNVSEDERNNLKSLCIDFKEKNKTLENQMNYILRNHLHIESQLNSFFEFAANYTILTEIPILDLENDQIYDELKENTDYTQEACKYVAKILSKIKSIINSANKSDIKIRKVTGADKKRITDNIQHIVDRLNNIHKTRKNERWIT